ncbi:MAG: phosphomannomutase/phosphoglucomutase [Gammaproteobacteria bacterium]|nr:phosphomannomutase/phosphoglucomutase [Gammaproteobacteria bacterium]
MTSVFQRLTSLLKHPGFLLAAAILLAAPLPVGNWLRDVLVTEPQAAAAARTAHATADAAAAAVADAVARWRIALSAIAARDSTRAALSAAGANTARLPLPAEFPDAIEVIATARPEALPATAFVAQQLVRNALSGTAFAITALKPDATQWQLVLAAQIPEAGRPLGAILVVLPMTALAHALAFDQSHGQLTLLQQAPGAPPQSILALGPASTQSPVTAPVPGVAGWQAAVRLSDGTAAEHSFPGLILAATLTPWLLALAALAVCGRLLLQRRGVHPPSDPATAPPRLHRAAVITAREQGTASPPPAPPRDSPTSNATEPLREPAPPAAEDDPAFASQGALLASPEPYPAVVFRDCDIRGASGTHISPAFANALGKTLGSLAQDGGGRRVAVGRDGRISSPTLCAALIDGLLATGCEVVDVGMVPTPVLYFAAARLPSIDAAVMVTASHNPAGDNGFKIMLDGAVLQGDALRDLRKRMLARDWREGTGIHSSADVRNDYIDAVLSDVKTRTSLSVVIDCGNGVAGDIAPRLLEALGGNPIPLYCDIDGTFPQHPPDPACPANLEDLRKVVAGTGADLGIALDGDGDRLVAVSGSGRIVWPDELLMIFARDILTSHPGADVVFDVKSTRRLTNLVNGYGGQAVMCRTGHAHIRAKVAELKAPLGGEFSGHIFFGDRWFGFDDGLYAAARLLEILSLREQNLDSILAAFETSVATAEIRLPVSEADKFALIERIQAAAVFDDAKISVIDGLRVEFAAGWGLIRTSNTESAVSLRFEADDARQLKAIQQRFRTLLEAVAPELADKF